jgi:hypothetical protein
MSLKLYSFSSLKLLCSEMKRGDAAKGHCNLQWLNLFPHCRGRFCCLWHWICDFSGKWSDTIWGFKFFGNWHYTINVVVITASDRSCNTRLTFHAAFLYWWYNIWDSYHVKWCPFFSDKLCSHSIYFIWFLWQEEAQAREPETLVPCHLVTLRYPCTLLVLYKIRII